MKTGIIVIFHNNEKDIDLRFFIQQINTTKNLKLCLVNNCSKDNTYKLLKEVKEACETKLSLVNIKKFKTDVSAVRAGARYMSNQFDLSHIGYVTSSSINTKYNGLNDLIKAVCENQQDILKYNIDFLEKQEIKLTLFQSLFSVIEYLKKIKIENQFLNLQYLNKL